MEKILIFLLFLLNLIIFSSIMSTEKDSLNDEKIISPNANIEIAKPSWKWKFIFIGLTFGFIVVLSLLLITFYVILPS